MPLLPSLLLLAGCLGASGVDVPTATVTQGPFEVVLAIPGELEAVNSEAVSAERGGKVSWIIEEGARVDEGDVLVRMDDTELVKALEEAEQNLETALTKIEQRKAQLDVRLADLRNEIINSELSLQRARMRVTDSETVPRVERESARLDVESSSIAVERSKAAMESARLETEAELELLRLDAKRAQRNLDDAREALEEAVITAPAPGLVIIGKSWSGGTMATIKAGTQVWGATRLVTLPDLSEMQVVAWVHEVDAPRVSTGQPVEVVIEAVPEPTHAGTVEKLADLAVQRDEGKEVKHLKVTVALDETSDGMKPGMTVRAEVQVSSHDDVLSVPLEAVFYEGDQPFVRRSALTGFERVDVGLGEANDTHVIVTEGLDAGDRVALLDPEAAARGETLSPGRPAEDSDE